MNIPSLFNVAFSKYEFSKKFTIDSTFSSYSSTAFISYLMIALAVCFGTNEMKANAISCWAKPVWVSFSRSWLEYGTSVCYTEGLYVGLLNESYIERDFTSQKIVNYQWLPYIFVVMAVVLRIPEFIWKKTLACSSFSLISFFSYDYRESDEAYVKIVTVFKDEYCVQVPRHSSVLLSCIPVLERIWASTLHKRWDFNHIHIFKIFANVLHHTYAENGNDYLGLKILTSWWTGSPYNRELVFPQLTDCVFDVREMLKGLQTSIRPFRMMCEVPLYTYLEYCFVFLWILLVILLLLNTYNFFKWLIIVILSKYFIEKWVRSMAPEFVEENPHFKPEFSKRLGLDGRLILLMPYFEMQAENADSILRIVFSLFITDEMLAQNSQIHN